MAAIGGSMEVIRFLVDQASDRGGESLIEAKGEDSQTPLIFTTRMGHAEAARYLAQSGADLGAQDRTGKTALHYAVLNCPQVVKDIFNGNKDAACIQDNDGCTPIHVAARSGSEEATKTVLAAAEDSNCILAAVATVDTKNKTALHYAAENGYTEVAKLLIDAGATVDCEDSEHRTPAQLAAEHGYLSTLKTVESGKAGDGPRLLVSASKAGQLLIVQYLLQNNVSPERGNEHTQTGPLSVAAMQGHNDVVLMLLRHGANMNREDSERKTALHYAVQNGFIEVVQTLLGSQVNINAPDSLRYTPLHHAARCGQVEVARLLLDNGAEVRARSQQGETPLHLAVESAKMAQLLLARGAEASSEDSLEQTPLHIAAQKGSPPSVQLLIRMGADINASDADLMTPMYYAIRQNNLAMAEELSQNDVDQSHRLLNVKLAIRISKLNVLRFLTAKTTGTPWKAHELDDCPLMAVNMQVGSAGVVSILLEAGASVDAADPQKRTALYWAVLKRSVSVIMVLLEGGADVGLCSVKMAFLKACLDFIPENLEDSGLGFRELRATTEIDETDHWTRLAQLIRDDHGETDQDGWNIHHFMHQAAPRLNLADYEEKELSKTKTPSAIVWPRAWQNTSGVCKIYAGGLSAFFESEFGTLKLVLRSDHPFPPRKLGLSYFEMTFKSSGLDGSDHPDPIICIGMSGEFCNQAQALPGWHQWSVGYHSHDGRIFDQTPSKNDRLAPVYEPGHTVGCGVDYNTGEDIFTLDGEIVCTSSHQTLNRHPSSLLFQYISLLNGWTPPFPRPAGICVSKSTPNLVR